jgi:hypothetical protein
MKTHGGGATYAAKNTRTNKGDAQNYLGTMFFEGRGVAQSDTEAARWFREAVDQGLADAQ